MPTSSAVLGILEEAKAHSTGKLDAVVFPGLKRQPLSDMTLSKALKTDGGDGYTVHGFRSSFRDWCAETGINNDWAESALAHVVPNRVEAAYRRTRFLTAQEPHGFVERILQKNEKSCPQPQGF